MSSDLAVLGGPPAVPAGSHRPWPDIRQEDKDAVAKVLERGVLTGSGSVEAPALERAYLEDLRLHGADVFESGEPGGAGAPDRLEGEGVAAL